MRNWLLCIALLLRWMCCMSQDEITCGPPNIAHGSVSKAIYQISCNEGYKPADRDEATCTRDGWSTRLECIAIVCRQPQIDHGSVQPRQLLYQYQDSIDTSCEEGYSNSATSFCTALGWQPPPACTPKRCEYPHVQNGRVDGWRMYFPKKPGSTLHFTCNSGFLPENKNTWHLSFCTNRGWEPEPKCFKKCDPPRGIPHGSLEAFPQLLIEGNEIAFECDPGYVPENQQTTITCTKNGWLPTPSCVAPGKCDRPPSIENGDIIELAKQEYQSGERVTYKCQRYYNMEGNKVVSCQDGRWSDAPKCIVPCTASEEDMERNKIRLRWSTAEKLYAEDGDATEFICKPGFSPAVPTSRFRVQCVNGTFEYPRCE